MEWFSHHHFCLFPPEIGAAQWNCWLRQSLELRYAWSGLPYSSFILIYLLIHIHGQHSLNRHGFVSELVHHHLHPQFCFFPFYFARFSFFWYHTHLSINNVSVYLKTNFSLASSRNWEKVRQRIATALCYWMVEWLVNDGLLHNLRQVLFWSCLYICMPMHFCDVV